MNAPWSQFFLETGWFSASSAVLRLKNTNFFFALIRQSKATRLDPLLCGCRYRTKLTIFCICEVLKIKWKQYLKYLNINCIFFHMFSLCMLQKSVRKKDLKQITRRLNVSQEQCSILSVSLFLLGNMMDLEKLVALKILRPLLCASVCFH